MKKTLCTVGMLTVLMIAAGPAGAQSTWTGASGTDLNWATPGNWLPAAPTATDGVRFFDDGATNDAVSINNTVTVDATVLSLWYGQTNGLHNTLINPGATLTLSGTGGGHVLLVGTETQPSVTQVVSSAISGPGGALVINNTNADLFIRQSHGSAGDHLASLDLSGLDEFTADLSRVLVGVGDSTLRRAMGNLTLAKTNVLTLSGGSPQLLVGDNGGNNNGNGSVSYLTLGLQTTLSANTIRIGGQKQRGTIVFSNSLSSLKLRGSDGVSRVNEFGVGDNSSQGGSGNPTTGIADLSSGTVDLLVDTLYLGRGQTSSGGGGATGTLNLGAGTLDVNTLQVGYQNAANAVGAVSGTITVGSNGLYSAGASLIVHSNLNLGRSAGSTAAINSTLNINGGTVVAPRINIGGTVTAISVTAGGLLTVTDPLSTIGTVDVPLGTLTLSGSAITIPGNGGEIVATTFNAGDASSIVNVSSLPAITSYPAEIPIIRYTTGDFQTPSLGTLPSASPAYQGTLSNDFAGNIYLVLTGGPVTITLNWTGAAGSDWDTTSLNWLKGATASAFTPGDPVQFTDSASGTTAVNLVLPVTPSSLLVSNNAKTYTFTGPGSLSGTAGITKKGSGTLLIENQGANDFTGDISISGGTLQVGDGTTNGNIPSVAIANDGSFIFNRSDDFNLSAPISGSGSMTKEGSGTLTLSGDTPYTGATAVNDGTLVFAGSSTGGGGPVTVAAGGTLANGPLNSLINSSVTASGRLDPGAGGDPVAMNVNALTLNPGARLKFDFNDTTGDSLGVYGATVANNTTIEVGFRAMPVTGVPYLIFTGYGGVTGGFNSTVAGTHYGATLDTNSAPGYVYITFSGAGANMKWASTTSGVWSGSESNWLNFANSQSEPFYGGDTALLDDSIAGVVTNLTIASGINIVAAGLTNNSSLNDFTIGGGGAIVGSANVVKDGTSTLTLGTSNAFTGTVEVRGGTLKVGSRYALGSTAAGTSVTNGATLDVNGQQLNAEPITVGGAGVGGAGAIVNSGADQVNAIGTVTITGDTTFGGAGRWDVRGGGAKLTSASGTAYNLVKVGTNQVSLVAATVDANLHNVDVQEGTFAIQTSTIQNSSGFGDPTGTITIHSNASLNVYNLNNGGFNPMDKVVDILDGGTVWSDSGSTVLSGPMTTHGAATMLCDGGTTLSLSNVVSGAGGLVKTGSGTLNLYGVNTYTGDTVLTSGTVALLESGSLATSARILVQGGTLNVSGRTDGTLTLSPGQTLGGNGVITGNVMAGAGTVVAPGASAGTLTVSGDASLGGTTVMEIDAGNTPANDKLVAANISFGGTLVVTNIGGLITGTNVFDLFDGTLAQSFGTVVLPDISGVTWDASNLDVDGTIMAIGPLINSEPVSLAAAVAGGQLSLSWPADHTGWRLQAQTNNLATGLGTNWFDVVNSSGTNQVTVPVDPANPAVFYRLVYP